MDTSEEIAQRYLLGISTNLVYEPDGNIPPDFVMDGNVAIEVRRLSQSVATIAGREALEQAEIPLRSAIHRVMDEFGHAGPDGSWFIFYRFKRPLPARSVFELQMRAFLESFKTSQVRQRTEERLQCGVELKVFKAHNRYDGLFVEAGFSDEDSGGWLLEAMERNIKLCVEEKTQKIQRVRSKYPVWWLVLIDFIGFGLDDFDRELFRDRVRIEHDWDKVILLDPNQPSRSFVV